MGNGAYIEGDLTHGLSLSYSKSTSETTDDPKLSQQLSSNGKEEQFGFEYNIEGTNSYNSQAVRLKSAPLQITDIMHLYHLKKQEISTFFLVRMGINPSV